MRTVGCLIVHSVSLFVLKQSITFTKKESKWVFARSVAGTFSFLGLIYALKNLPIAMFQIVFNTCPFWAALIAYFLLDERLKRIEIGSMILSFTLIVLLFIS